MVVDESGVSALPPGEAGVASGGVVLGMLIIAAIYQDVPLARQVGSIGLSPFFYAFPFLVAMELLELRAGTPFLRSATDRYIATLLTVAHTIGLAVLLVLALKGTYEYLGDSFLVKAVKVSLYMLLPWLAYRRFAVQLAPMSPATMARTLTLVTVGILLFTIVERLLLPYAFPTIHASEFPYNRLRLLTSEASTSGTVVVVLSCLTVACSRALPSGQRLWARTAAGTLLVTYTVLGASKGYFLVLALSAMLFGIALPTARRSVLRVLGGTAVGAALAVALFQRAADSLLTSLTETTTLATRAIMTLGPAALAAHIPTGVGFGASQYLLAARIDDIGRWFGSILPEAANFAELDTYSYSSFGLYPKSGLSEFLLFGGLFGAVLFFLLIRQLWRASRASPSLRLAVTFAALALTTYVTFANKYDIWMLFAFVERLGREPRPQSA